MDITEFIYIIRSESNERKRKNQECRIELRKFGADKRVMAGVYETADSRNLLKECSFDNISKDDMQRLLQVLRERHYVQCEWIRICNNLVFEYSPLEFPIDEYSSFIEKMLQSPDGANVNEKAILFDTQYGINNRSQFWLLLIASEARGAIYDDLPDFVEKTFQRFDVPSHFEKKDCASSVRDFLKSKPWRNIRNQEEMLSFIRDNRQQEAKRKADEKIANYLFVQLKDYVWKK